MILKNSCKQIANKVTNHTERIIDYYIIKPIIMQQFEIAQSSRIIYMYTYIQNKMSKIAVSVNFAI